MTTLEYTADRIAVPDRDSLVDCLLGHLPADRISDLLKDLSFTDIVGAIERAGNAAQPSCIVQLYRGWIASQPAGSPYLFAAWFNLGVSLTQAADRPGAIVAYQNALAVKPDFHAAATNLGLALEAIGQADVALQTWERALQPDDARTTLLNQRARLLEQLHRFGDAEREMRRSLLTDPKQPDVIQHWVHVRQKMCAWPSLTEELPGLPAETLLRHAGPLSVLALSDDIHVQREAARDWIQRKTFKPREVLSPPDGYRHDRVRLGYMSSDYCQHALSYLIAELFERHDRERFEVLGYCSSPDDGSEIRARVLRSFDHYRSIKTLSDEQAARLIRDDEIDILVDLNGLTSGARAQILRWKPAPIQATYLGFIGSVPLPELDYMFCDDVVVPPHLASGYEPRPLYIAENFQANDTRRSIGAPVTRAGAGLPEDRFVLCCFSNHYKMTESVFGAWMSILQRSPDSVLWMVGDNEWARDSVVRNAEQRGIARDRILFASRVGPDEYMARLSLADLFLDTFPYNAGTIASDAIRMGLPLATISGQAFASRMAGRLLTAMGAHDGIASNVQQYIEFATRMATDPDAYAAYKALFNAQSWQRAIGDITSFTTAYEATLLSIAKRG